MVKALRHGHSAVMKSIYNTENKPLNQYQNNHLKKVNVSVLIINPLHNRSCGVLEPYLPSHGCITINFKQIKEHRKHL
jgi:hypothetical protein